MSAGQRHRSARTTQQKRSLLWMRGTAAFRSSVGWLSLLAMALRSCSFEESSFGSREDYSLAGPYGLLDHLLFLAFAVYLFTVGRRAISIAKGNPRRRMRFGWGRILLGTVLIFHAASTRFHLFPASVLEYEDHTQGADIAVCIGSLFLVVSGIRKGFRRQTMQPELYLGHRVFRAPAAYRRVSDAEASRAAMAAFGGA